MPNWAKLIFVICMPLAAAGCQAQSYQKTYTQQHSTVVSDQVSRAELDQILAPIALYPDTVLSHVLIASTYPLEVVQANRWAQRNSQLSGEEAVDAVEHKTWDPSVRALVAFPEILQRMSEDLEWTQQLGDAFLLDEARVMDAIQHMREKAYAAGSLNKMKHVSVERDEKIIVIEPAVERVVYIPYYDPRVVYGSWWWPQHPPTYWSHPREHVYVNGFYWGPRAYLGSSFFFTSFHWHQHRVVHIDYRQHHHPRTYSGRHISRFEGARRWQHNPVHRRGVAYRNQSLREHYGNRATGLDNRATSVRQLQQQRSGAERLRDSATSGSDRQDKRQVIERTSQPQRAESIREHLSRQRSTPAVERRSTTRDSDAPRREAQSATVLDRRQEIERREVPSSSVERRTETKSRTSVFERRRESLQERRTQPPQRPERSVPRAAPPSREGASRRESMREHLQSR